MAFHRISIIGLGLIGGSVAMACRKHLSSCQIIGCDPSPDARQRALAAKALDEASADLKLAAEGADCVILCVPLTAIPETMAAIARHLKPGACVTDVSSVKQTVLAHAHRLLPADVHFVGGHPMAGRELSGFAAARYDLFEGAALITTPLPTTDAGALEAVESLWRSLGAKPIRLSPQQHDELVAQISHVPHLLASAIINAVTEPAMEIAGPGFRDLTRIAAGDGALWRDILKGNADEVRQFLKRFRSELDRADAMLASGEAKELEIWLAAAAARRRSIGKAHS